LETSCKKEKLRHFPFMGGGQVLNGGFKPVGASLLQRWRGGGLGGGGIYTKNSERMICGAWVIETGRLFGTGPLGKSTRNGRYGCDSVKRNFKRDM